MKFPKNLDELLDYGDFRLDSKVVARLKNGWVYRNPPETEINNFDSDYIILEKKTREGKLIKLKLGEQLKRYGPEGKGIFNP